MIMMMAELLSKVLGEVAFPERYYEIAIRVRFVVVHGFFHPCGCKDTCRKNVPSLPPYFASLSWKAPELNLVHLSRRLFLCTNH